MTDNITMPRSVVERALEALYTSMPHNNDMDEDWPSHIAARRALRAALEQPNHIAQHLNMVPEGWKLVPVEPTAEMLNAWCEAENKTSKHLHASDVMQAGYRAMLAAAPQPPTVKDSLTTRPQVEQEPVAWQGRDGYLYHFIEEPKPGDRPLYTHPQSPRHPLTDDQIGEIESWFSNEFGLEAKHSIDFARAIEAAHGIAGEQE